MGVVDITIKDNRFYFLSFNGQKLAWLSCEKDIESSVHWLSSTVIEITMSETVSGIRINHNKLVEYKERLLSSKLPSHRKAEYAKMVIVYSKISSKKKKKKKS